MTPLAISIAFHPLMTQRLGAAENKTDNSLLMVSFVSQMISGTGEE